MYLLICVWWRDDECRSKYFMCLCVLSLVKDFQSVCTFMVPGSPSFTTTSKNINTKDCKRQTQEREKNKCIICFEFKIESYTVDSPEFFRGFNFSRCIVFDFFFFSSFIYLNSTYFPLFLNYFLLFVISHNFLQLRVNWWRYFPRRESIVIKFT